MFIEYENQFHRVKYWYDWYVMKNMYARKRRCYLVLSSVMDHMNDEKKIELPILVSRM